MPSGSRGSRRTFAIGTRCSIWLGNTACCRC
jgi:hypothetical protein